MIASAANGFMNTNPVTCSRHGLTTSSPNTRAQRRQNLLPWGAGPYMLDNRVRDSATSSPAPRSPSRGPSRLRRLHRHVLDELPGPVRHGERRTRASSRTTPPATRSATPTEGRCAPNLVTGCDGSSTTRSAISTTTERPTTPTGRRRPTGPVPGNDPSGPADQPRPDLPADPVRDRPRGDRVSTLRRDHRCRTARVPPPGPGHFYPYWTLVNDRQLGCTWQFGNAGRTGNSFGGDAQYGQITFNPPGAFTSADPAQPGV